MLDAFTLLASARYGDMSRCCRYCCRCRIRALLRCRCYALRYATGVVNDMLPC